jgi:hypothetical protein
VAEGVDGPSRAEIEAQIARQKANAAWAARYQGLADNIILSKPLTLSNKIKLTLLNNLPFPVLNLLRPFGFPDFSGVLQANLAVDQSANFTCQYDHYVETVDGNLYNINGTSIPPIVVAASYALESNGYNWYTDTKDGWLYKLFGNENSSGLGPGQFSDTAMDLLGLSGADQTNPDVAAEVLAIKTASYLSACVDCAPEDLLIIAAMGHTDNFLTPELVTRAINRFTGEENRIDWEGFINDDLKPSKQSLWKNIVAGGRHFSSQYLVTSYLGNMLELHDSFGWELPYSMSEQQILDLIEEVEGYVITGQE